MGISRRTCSASVASSRPASSAKAMWDCPSNATARARTHRPSAPSKAHSRSCTTVGGGTGRRVSCGAVAAVRADPCQLPHKVTPAQSHRT